MKNYLKVGLAVLAALLLLDNCFGCSDEAEYEEETTITSERVEEEDYSWIYGKWELNEGGDRYIVTFTENGMYVETLISPTWGNSSGAGSYRIKGNKIVLDSGDGYPSYITIEGRRLKDQNGYYRKR